MNHLTFHYRDLGEMRAALEAAGKYRALEVGAEHTIRDGSWVLAVFEFACDRRATAAAGRAVVQGSRTLALFEGRDWARLVDFASPIEPSAASNPHRSQSVPDGPRALVVEDERITRELIAAHLEGVDLRVTAVESAEEAQAEFERGAYDILVLDWTLPGMNGLDFCRWVRRRPDGTSISILFLTANQDQDAEAEAVGAGADDYILKPIPGAELCARVAALLRRAANPP